MKRERMGRCEVGNHAMPADELGCCAVCRTAVCVEHQGNRKPLAGDLIACPKHVKEVAELNRANLEQIRARLRRPEGEW